MKFEIWNLEFGIWNLKFGIWNLESGIWSLEFGVWSLEFGPDTRTFAAMALSNNDIFKKLRVALKLRDEDIVNICALVDFKVTRSELGAIFRNEDHPKYVECGDQFLRNFLNGLVIHMRGPMPNKVRSTKLEGKKEPGDKNKDF